MITTSPARDKEDLRIIMVNLLSNIFGNQLVIGDIHAPMNEISDIFSIKQGNEIIGGWTIFKGFKTPTLGFPIDPTGWDAIKGMLSMMSNKEYVLPFPVNSENDHGHRPWHNWPRAQSKLLFTDIAMRITDKDIEVRDISDLPEIRAVTDKDIPDLEKYYEAIGPEFSGFFHPLQLRSDNYVVCVDNGEIVATAGTHFETPYTVQLGNIHVKEQHRGKGIGRAVTTAVVLGSIKSQRVPTLFVNEQNTSAIQLYSEIGFEEYNRFEFHQVVLN